LDTFLYYELFRQIGGATGLVGDPSGRAEERKPADQAKTEYDTTKLKQSLTTFFERAMQYAHTRLPPSAKIIPKPTLVNNKEWLQHLGLLDFLRSAGIHIRLNTMLARERYVSMNRCVEYNIIL
jgi:tyrosyl-tRNA synthetase